jgi:hypothetical protein
MTTAYRDKMLADIITQRGLKKSGFRRALRALVKEHYVDDPADHDEITFEFDEFFGDLTVVPAAYKIENDDHWRKHVHVYELAISARLPDRKIQQYGRAADGGGPLLSLHIFDAVGKEIILKNQTLERFCYADSYGYDLCWERAREECIEGGGAVVIHEVHSTIHTTKPEERAILRAVYELGLFQHGDLK